MARQVALLMACAFVALLSACGGGSDADTTAPKTAQGAPVATLAPVATQAPSDADLRTDDVKVDVGGHELFIACRGNGSPTVVYLHGMGGLGRGAVEISDKLGKPRPRYCGYDRPNGLGISDTLSGPLTGKDSVEDLHALLAAADVPPPYVLLGASYGGLIADMYAATYPEEVVGMVLLDSPLPDMYKYELRFIPKEDRLKLDSWKESPERMDELTTFRQAQALQGREPRIPVTYIAVKRLDLPPSYPRKKITAAERNLQRDFLERFSPGRLVVVDTDHHMEPVIPGRIARAVEGVIAASAG